MLSSATVWGSCLMPLSKAVLHYGLLELWNDSIMLTSSYAGLHHAMIHIAELNYRDHNYREQILPGQWCNDDKACYIYLITIAMKKVKHYHGNLPCGSFSFSADLTLHFSHQAPLQFTSTHASPLVSLHLPRVCCVYGGSGLGTWMNPIEIWRDLHSLCPMFVFHDEDIDDIRQCKVDNKISYASSGFKAATHKSRTTHIIRLD